MKALSMGRWRTMTSDESSLYGKMEDDDLRDSTVRRD